MNAATAAAGSDPGNHQSLWRQWTEPFIQPAREQPVKKKRQSNQRPTVAMVHSNARETTRPQTTWQIAWPADRHLPLGHHRQAEPLARDAAVPREVAL
jgi:hypothetical protein